LKFCFIIPVWGASFSKTFEELSIPALLSSKNFGSSLIGKISSVHIASDFSTKVWLEKQKNFKDLKRHVETQFILIEDIYEENSPHITMTNAYLQTIEKQLKKNPSNKNYFIFLTPDSIWSNGSFSHLIGYAKNGYEAIFVAGLRVNKQSSWRSWKREAAKQKSHRFFAKNMLSITLRNLHSMSKELNFLGERFNNEWPAHLYFINRDKTALVAKCFHLHPLMVYVKKNIKLGNDTIDGNFVKKLNIPEKKKLVINNIDQCFGIDMTCSTRRWGCPVGRPNLQKIMDFVITKTNTTHRQLFKKEIIFSASKATINIDTEIYNLISRIEARLLSAFSIRNKFERLIKKIFGSIVRLPIRLKKSVNKRFAFWKEFIFLSEKKVKKLIKVQIQSHENKRKSI
jgi:hypothetical protein